MEKYKRNAVYSPLEKYDILAAKDAFIEVTEWRNGEGFDVEIYSHQPVHFQLTWGQMKALKKLVKSIEG